MIRAQRKPFDVWRYVLIRLFIVPPRSSPLQTFMNVSLTLKGKKAALFTKSVINQIENDIRSELTRVDIDILRNLLESVRNTLGGTDPSI